MAHLTTYQGPKLGTRELEEKFGATLGQIAEERSPCCGYKWVLSAWSPRRGYQCAQVVCESCESVYGGPANGRVPLDDWRVDRAHHEDALRHLLQALAAEGYVATSVSYGDASWDRREWQPLPLDLELEVVPNRGWRTSRGRHLFPEINDRVGKSRTIPAVRYETYGPELVAPSLYKVAADEIVDEVLACDGAQLAFRKITQGATIGAADLALSPVVGELLIITCNEPYELVADGVTWSASQHAAEFDRIVDATTEALELADLER